MRRPPSDLVRYSELLQDIKKRIRQAQTRAALSANAEMLWMYWDIGRMVAKRQKKEGWGKGLLSRLATDLKNDIPQIKGFSERNLQLMIQFQDEYPNLFPIPQRPVAEFAEKSQIRPQSVPELALPTLEQVTADEEETQIAQRVVAQLPWVHNVILIQKLKNLPLRLWYARQTIVQGWSRNTLTAMIKSRAHERQGAAVTNFDLRLPSPQSELAQATLKDPYLFDFMTLDQPFRERELEAGLVAHLERFLLELGAGFAFVGRQYHVDIAEDDFYIDLLFYHLKLRAFVVIDLKIGPFKPEYAGKMNFYCNVVDDRLRHSSDNPTIGLILCQDKKRCWQNMLCVGWTSPSAYRSMS